MNKISVKLFFTALMTALILVGCTDQFALDEVAKEVPHVTPTSEFQMLKEKAKWGDGKAYLKLADCYRDGRGVKQDFIGMLSMASLANDYGGINRMEEYLDSLPKDSDYKLIIDCVEKLEHKQTEEAHAMIERLAASESPDGYAIIGISVLERGDSLEAVRLFGLGAEKGSSFAELLLCISDWRDAMNPSIERLAALANKIPWVYNTLAETYIGRRGYKLTDDNMAAYYYLKADQQACLTKSGAKWLLNYLKNGGNLHLSATDFKRLQILADEDFVVVLDTLGIQ